MSNEKPERVEVGQRWREGVQSVHTPYTVKRERDGRFTVAFDDRTDDDSDIWYRPEEILRDHFLGWAPGYGPSPGTGRPGVGERDWSRWLPPRRLPSVPGQRFKTGQVFASSCLDGDFTVCRVLEKLSDNPWMHKIECLASRNSRHSVGATFECSATFYRMDHAVLVADVGCEPTPPEVLYASALPAPAVPPEQWELPPGAQPHRYGRLVGETRAPDGTPLSALQAVACRRSSEDLKKSPPWVPSIDEDHWIPEVGERGTR